MINGNRVVNDTSPIVLRNKHKINVDTAIPGINCLVGGQQSDYSVSSSFKRLLHPVISPAISLVRKSFPLKRNNLFTSTPIRNSLIKTNQHLFISPIKNSVKKRFKKDILQENIDISTSNLAGSTVKSFVYNLELQSKRKYRRKTNGSETKIIKKSLFLTEQHLKSDEDQFFKVPGVKTQQVCLNSNCNDILKKNMVKSKKVFRKVLKERETQTSDSIGSKKSVNNNDINEEQVAFPDIQLRKCSKSNSPVCAFPLVVENNINHAGCTLALNANVTKSDNSCKNALTRVKRTKITSTGVRSPVVTRSVLRLKEINSNTENNKLEETEMKEENLNTENNKLKEAEMKKDKAPRRTRFQTSNVEKQLTRREHDEQNNGSNKNKPSSKGRSKNKKSAVKKQTSKRSKPHISLEQFYVIPRKSGFLDLPIRNEENVQATENGETKRIRRPPKPFVQCAYVGTTALRIGSKGCSYKRKTYKKELNDEIPEVVTGSETAADVEVLRTPRAKRTKIINKNESITKATNELPCEMMEDLPEIQLEIHHKNNSHGNLNVTNGNNNVLHFKSLSNIESRNQNETLQSEVVKQSQNLIVTENPRKSMGTKVNEITSSNLQTDTNEQSDNVITHGPVFINWNEENNPNDTEITADSTDQRMLPEKFIETVVNGEYQSIKFYTNLPKVKKQFSRDVELLFLLKNVKSESGYHSNGYLKILPAVTMPIKQTETYSLDVHVVSGEGLAVVQGINCILYFGSTVHIPIGCEYYFKNTSAEDDLLMFFTMQLPC